MNAKTLLVFWLVLCGQAWGYVFTGDTAVWQPGSIPFQIKLGSATALQDGTNHSTSVQEAMTSWNAQLGTVQFAPTIVAQSSSTDPDHDINEIVFSDTVEGDAFGENVLAVTVSYSYPTIHQRTQSDIFFNTAYTWDSYRGPWQSGQGAGKDIRRVALHELGHALGLGHPNEQGQPGVTAVMNSTANDIDKLEADDIAGAQFLYRAPGNTSPAANNAFASATTIDLNNNAAVVTGTTYYATKEAGEPNHAGYLGGKSVWWKWTAPKNGSVSLTTQGTYFDTLLGVYTGAAVSALSVVASNDQAADAVSYSSLTFNATNGTTYFIAVDGWDGQSGFVSLGLTFFPEIENSPPAITSQPAPQSVNAGQTATFNVAASGYPAPAYQWQRLPAAGGSWTNLGNGTYYSGVTTSTLTVSSAAVSLNGDQFRCVATNSSGTTTSNPAQLSVAVVAVSSVSAGTNHTLFLKPNGTLWGVGGNNNGQLGDGTVTERLSPIFISDNVASASAGDYFSLFVKSDGTLWGMGGNYRGVLGDGTVTSRRVPVQVASGVRSVAAGDWHTMFIKTDGTLWGTGYNDKGQLGDGTTPDIHVLPVQVASNVTSVAVGSHHTLYLKTDQTLWAMGSNTSGQLGDGSTTQRNTPVQIATAVVSVAAGSGHSLFVKTDGTLWAMGSNYLGQLGDGTLTQRNSPVLIAGNVASVSAGWSYTTFLKTDGTLWAMGHNSYGALGDGTEISKSTPIQMASRVTSVSAGREHAMFILADQTLWGTGRNGGLGIAGLSFQIRPVQVVPFVPGLPLIVAQPLGRAANAGSPLTLSVTARSTLATTFQWQKNGVNIPGATSSSLSITQVQRADAGSYTVVVSTAAGSVTSSAATLVVNVDARDFNGDGKSDLVWQNAATGERVVWLMNGTGLGQVVSLGNIPLDWSIAATADFNADGQSDLVWQNAASGQRDIWLMNGTAIGQVVSLGVIPLDWSIAGAGDFNANGQPDLVWQNAATGERVIWLMNGTGLSQVVSLGNIPLDWSIAGAADFNADGQADLVWQNSATGQRDIWLMNGTSLGQLVSLGNFPLDWSIAGTGDFNADGQSDLLWQNFATGQRDIWLMNGTALGQVVSLGTISLDWSIGLTPGKPKKPVAGDFDADRHSDILWSDTTTGERAMWLMNGTTVNNGTVIGTVPVAWTFSGTGDYNGDGKADIFWTNTATGDRAMWLMNGTVMGSNAFLGTIPVDWAVAGSGDYNGDGKADVLWSNTTSGDRSLWLMDGSTVTGGGYLGTISPDWVVAGTGDYNGDGKADILWSNTTTGERAMWLMNGTTSTGGAVIGTVPVAWVVSGSGDYNGDGKADILWTNTATGDRAMWLMNGTVMGSNAFLGTIPVDWVVAGSGDYNGDGKADVLWSNTTTGDRSLWLMDGSAIIGGGYMGTIPVQWRIAR